MPKGKPRDGSKNPGGRPIKLSDVWLDTAEEALKQDMYAIIFTEEELVDEVNDRIKDKYPKKYSEYTISYTTFKNYKAENKDKKQDEIDGIWLKFLSLLKKALRIQKTKLSQLMATEEKSWQRFAWFLERKFDEFNLRNINENNNKNEHIFKLGELHKKKKAGKKE